MKRFKSTMTSFKYNMPSLAPALCSAGKNAVILGLVTAGNETIEKIWPKAAIYAKVLAAIGCGSWLLSSSLAWCTSEKEKAEAMADATLDDVEKAKTVLKKYDPDMAEKLKVKRGEGIWERSRVVVGPNVPPYVILGPSAEDGVLMHEIGHLTDTKRLMMVNVFDKIVFPLGVLVGIPLLTNRVTAKSTGGTSAVAKYGLNIGLMGVALAGGKLLYAAMQRRLEAYADGFSCENTKDESLESYASTVGKGLVFPSDEPSHLCKWVDSVFCEYYPPCVREQRVRECIEQRKKMLLPNYH